MAFVGKVGGLRLSEILNRLGYKYFGISPAQLENDILWEEDSESREVVIPVRTDKAGRRPYILFSNMKEKKTKRYFLTQDEKKMLGDEFQFYYD